MQSLKKKPTKLGKLQWDKFDELSDLSADETESDKKPQTTTSISKFIKKKTEPQSVATSQKPAQTLGKAHTAGDAASRSTLGNDVYGRSSALGKAQSFAAKYSASRVAAGRVTAVPSDSDLELSLSPDEEVLADVRAVKHKTATGHVTADTGRCNCLHVYMVYMYGNFPCQTHCRGQAVAYRTGISGC